MGEGEDPRLKSTVNWLIVCATVALVAVPVAYDQSQAEIARWQLAAAANALDTPGGEPEEYLARATAAVKSPEQLRDYWLFQTKRALKETDSSKVVEVLREALAADPTHKRLARIAASELWERQEWEAQIEVLELLRQDGKHLASSELNQLAYARSLASLELDKALEDINAALEIAPNEPAYRDTRAWVLHKMGRPLEALEDAEFAIQKLEELERSDWMGGMLQRFERVWESTPEPAGSEATLSRRKGGEQLWTKGALYYHRARILDALGRTEEAQRDWDWLKKNRLPQDDQLF